MTHELIQDGIELDSMPTWSCTCGEVKFIPCGEDVARSWHDFHKAGAK